MPASLLLREIVSGDSDLAVKFKPIYRIVSPSRKAKLQF